MLPIVLSVALSVVVVSEAYRARARRRGERS